MPTNTDQRFRVWTCLCAVVLSTAAFMLALAGAVTHPGDLRAAAAVAAGCAALAWVGSGLAGWYDRRSIAPATRPKRLGRRYVVISFVAAVLTAAAELGVSVLVGTVPEAAAAGVLALVAGAGAAAWQIGLTTRVDLDAAAHMRGALTVAEPPPPEPGPAEPSPRIPAPRHGAHDQRPALDTPVSTAAAAEGVARRRRRA